MPKRTDLGGVKSEIDKLDIDELETNPFDLSKLSHVVKNKIAKKTVYNELMKNVHATDTSQGSN